MRGRFLLMRQDVQFRRSDLLRIFVLNVVHSFLAPGLSWICKWSTAGSLLAYQGHGISEWKNDAAFFRFFINKNGHILDLVDYEHVVPKGAIEFTEGKKVYFADGTEEEVDVIIQCTGYRTEFPFLPREFSSVPLCDNFKFIFNTDDPSLAFVGYARPVVGSISGMAEIQARWVGKVYNGEFPLPPKTELQKEAEKDKEFWRHYFEHSSHRLSTLVEGYTYMDDIGKRCGLYPDYWELFKTEPGEALMALFAPYCGCSYRLNEPKHRDWALGHLRKHAADTLSPTHLLLIAFLRLIWFDWWMNVVSALKYRIQVSRVWKQIRDTRPVRFLDWVWQAPKRWLFDSTTRA